MQAGTTLTFVNDDGAPHTATSDDGAATAFDTGTLQPGDSATITLDTAGTSPYHCDIHPSMQATIVVVDGGDTSAQAGDDGDGDDDGDSGY